MRNVLLTTATAAALSVAAFTVPAGAQAYFGVGPVGVEIGDGGYYGRDWDHGWRHRHWRGAYAYGGDCRVIRERIVRPSGRVIFRERRICD
jgi:hypothetical protein